MGSSLSRGDAVLILDDMVHEIDVGDIETAREIAVLLRQHLAGEIAIEQRDAIAGELGAAIVSH